MSSDPRIEPREIVPADMAEGAIVPPPAGSVEPYNPLSAGLRRWANFGKGGEMTDLESVMLSKAYGETDLKPDQLIGREFQIKWALVRPSQVLDKETGELYSYDRVILYDETGTCVHFGSAGVVQSLAVLVACHGAGPWEPPLRVRLVQSSTRSGGRWYQLAYVGRAARPRAGKGADRA